MASLIQGSKGGSEQPRPAVEAPDSLQSTAYAKVLDLLGEGEIVGPVDGLRSVYLEETPVQAADGSMNFRGVTLELRQGTQDQRHIAGFPSVESEIAIGVELTAASPWVRSINNLELSAVRVRLSVPRLAKNNPANGDINGHRIEYAIDLATDGGAFVEVLHAAFDGKTTTKYERTHRVDLPPAVVGWSLRVRRLTANANDSATADTTNVEAITEVVDAKLRYPNSALAGLTFDASQFSGVPSRAYFARGRIIRVPSNYDPESRAYTGVWDGTFKQAWTNNPAWVYYDLLLNDRYGLGDRLNAGNVDKWELYRIARYCDEMVPDGKGGQEPRFTCFLYYQTRADALKVLQDIAAIFRGMTYWAGGSVVTSADMPDDPSGEPFTAANVIGGKFNYPGSARKTRYTVALVSWNDPTDFGRRKVEYVPDRAGLARYGVQQTEITGVGCSSQGQAQRLGRWALLTSRLETESVVFSVGLSGAVVRPGQVIRVADPNRAGRRIGGRLRAASADTATLDGDVVVAVGDRLVCTLPTGAAEVRTVAEVNGRVLRVTPAWSVVPRVQSVWAVESDELTPQLFRVMTIAEKGDADLTFDVTAVKHVPGKFGNVDSLTRIDAPPISVIPPGVQPPPTAVTLAGRTVIEQGRAVGVLSITWAAARSAVAYEVDWRRDSGEWVYAGRTGSLGIEVVGIYAGRYVARVRAINALDVGSIPATSAETQIAGKTSPPPAVTSITTTPGPMQLGVAWGFPEGLGAADTQRTEIWQAPTADRAQAAKLGDFAYPQARHTITGLAAGVSFYFWARLVDTSGNVGPWFPEGGGVLGQSSAAATELLDYLAGQISETELAAQLVGRIALIDGPAGTAGTVAQRVAAEAQARTAALQLEAQARGAAITTETEARQAADASLSSRIDTLTASSAGNAAAIQSEQTARANADTALGQRIDTVTATAAGNTAAITSEQTARANADAALTTRVDGLFAQANPPMAGEDTPAGSEAVLAGVWSEQSARAEEDLALGQRIDAVTAQVGAVSASVTSEQTARATADTALGQRIDTVTATADGASAAVQQVSQAQASTDGALSAMWSVKLGVTSDGKYYGAGMGVGIENTPAGMQSQVLFQADRFAVINVANGAISTPFVIQGGQVFINSAIIGDGTITTAKIASTLQSTDYVAGQSGWRLTKAGQFELNAAVAGQGRMAITNRAVKVYDGSGVLRVQLGDLSA